MIRHFSRIAVVSAFVALVCPTWAAEICIDPGHGGTDAGATNGCYGGSNYEKNNVLSTGLKFRDWMNADTNDGAGGGSWAVVMTRSSDVYVSLAGRTTFANNEASDRFMSMHNNAANCGACGTETFSYSAGSANSHTLRNQVQSRMIEAWARVNRGNKVANFYVIKYTNMPAELCEQAFVDSSIDNPYVSGAATQDSAAKAHLFAIQNHYGIAAYTPGGGGGAVDMVVDNNTGLFSASANWSTGTSAADKYGADYRFRATAAVSDKAGWLFGPSVTGNYQIMAWWPAGTNRSASAPFILPDNSTVNVNQQINGGHWNLLGTKTLTGGSLAGVSLSCWAATGFVVMADAIRMYKP